MPLSNLELNWIVNELKPIEGLFFDKISDLDSGWKMKFGKIEVVVEVPDRIHITKRKQAAREPRGFSQYLRKHLHGKIKSITQPNFDRVVVIEFETGKKLIFEMFSKGNVVLVGEDGLIEKTFKDEQWSARTNKRGEEYKFPPSIKLDPREMTKKEFDSLFGEKDLIHSLVSGINMSGKYLEEACVEAKLDKNSMKPSKKLFDSIKAMMENPKPFSETLDDEHATREADTSKSDKVERKLAQQAEAIGKLEKKADEAKIKGDLIYSRWTELDELISSIKEMRKEGKSYGEINKLMAGKALINEKTKKMALKL